MPTLDAPLLAFPEERVISATMLQARIEDLHRRYRRAFQPLHKKTLAMRIRKNHLALVSLAIGVKLPGHPTVIHEFAE